MTIVKSHSTRVRGLKFSGGLTIAIPQWMSHSTRVRGLKSHVAFKLVRQRDVALYTSAWIEIGRLISYFITTWVALYTSAWIEMTV